MRNVEKLIECGQKLTDKHPKMQILSREMTSIYDKNGLDAFNLISDSFFFGVAVGYRIARKEKKKD